MQNSEGVVIFIIICSLITLLLVSFVIMMVYRYQQKQHIFYRELEELKVAHGNHLLQSQLEIQEQTFQNISREIHDSIGQKLTLAKFYLNTLNTTKLNGAHTKIESAVEMIGDSIKELSDISRSMSSELILQNGLIRALEFEISQLTKLGLYSLKLKVSDKTIFLDEHTELVLFRIVQEALNNIVKHSKATEIEISLNYDGDILALQIMDNGTGFRREENSDRGIGLSNMNKRAKMLGGKCSIESNPGQGTIVIIEIPINEYTKTV